MEIETAILEILCQPCTRAEIYYKLYIQDLDLEFFRGDMMFLFCPKAQQALTKLLGENKITLNRANDHFVYQNPSRIERGEDYNLKAFRELKLSRYNSQERIPRRRV